MRNEKRSRWFLITCDHDGCDLMTTVHPALFEEDEPRDWFFIKPPRYWRGPALSFCSQLHRDAFVGSVVQPQLTSGE